MRVSGSRTDITLFKSVWTLSKEKWGAIEGSMWESVMNRSGFEIDHSYYVEHGFGGGATRETERRIRRLLWVKEATADGDLN